MFSKSKTKRFQEPSSTGPAPGQYDVKDIKSSSKGIVFEKDKRWRDPNMDLSEYSSSMENLSASGSFKSLVPLSQSTCTKKQPNTKSSKRKSCFVSSSATDLTSRFSLEADVEFQSDKIQDLQAKIMKLEAEISKLKAAAKDSLDGLSPSTEEIINEKLAIELEKRDMEEKYDCLMKSYDEIIKEKNLKEGLIKEQEKTVLNLEAEHINILKNLKDEFMSTKNMNLEYSQQIENIKLSLTDDCNKMKNQYESFQESFDLTQMMYLQRLEKSNLTVAKSVNLVSQLSQQLKLKKDVCDDLNAKLSSVIEESKKEKISFDKEKEEVMNQLADMESKHEFVMNNLNNELMEAKNWNLDYCQQIENIELSMTDNIREISRKYETLESTLEQTQRKYQQRLERSNAVVEKTIEANKKLNTEFENEQQMYADLQNKYCFLNSENDSIIMESNRKYKEYKEQTKSLQDQLNEKDVRIKEIERFVIETESDLSEKRAKLDELQRTITLFNVEIESKDNLITKYRSTHESMSSKAEEDGRQIVELKNKFDAMVSQEKHQSSIKSLTNQINEKNEEVTEYQRNEQELLEQLNKNKILFKEYEKNVQTLTKELEQSENMLCEKGEQIEEYERSIESMSKQVEAAKDSKASEEELNHLQMKLDDAENAGEEWRLKYEDLEKKVGPFMDQLEQFQLEKRSLLDQNSLTQQEMKNLSERYGQILGHQNNKQKIRHISKLKDENYQLKAEVMKLRATTQKDRVKINQLERASEGKRFGKENLNRDALKSVN